MSNSLKFLLDENIRIEVKIFLESKGFSVKYAEKGVSNGKLMSLAKNKEFIVLTRDRDFISASLFPPKDFFGIIVLTIHPPLAEKLIKSLKSLLESVKEFKGKLFIVREGGFEIID